MIVIPAMFLLAFIAASSWQATPQSMLVQPQNNTWNSSIQLTPAQIEAANLSDSLVHNVQVALNFEYTNYAGGPVIEDPFYEIPADYNASSPPSGGTILKLEQVTNTSLYTLPPSLSMTRFMYVTETLNGTLIPATAYILWPYLPKPIPNLRSYSGKNSSMVYPIIGFPHGTSGQQPNCAPSHIRNLWDSFAEPFAMALAGYAVVAPDNAGMGITGIPSPYFVFPAQANDLYLAIQAAQSAFPDVLSKEFVVAGQSLGGGVAWAGAKRQLQRPMEGYLGTVAASPFTDALADIAGESTSQANVRIAGIAQGLNSVLPDFKLSDWLTEIAVARINLIVELGACSATAAFLLGGGDGTQIVKPGWNTTIAAAWFQNTTTNGGQPFAGPMLVIQGVEDPNAIANVTTKNVQLTCEMYPDSQLNYYQFEGITHSPVLYAGQWLWLQWIEDRFIGKSVQKGCTQQVLSPLRGVANIVKEANWFIEFERYDYEG